MISFVAILTLNPNSQDLILPLGWPTQERRDWKSTISHLWENISFRITIFNGVWLSIIALLYHKWKGFGRMDGIEKRADALFRIIFFETFLKWVRTSVIFFEAPWLIFEPLHFLISRLRLKQFPKLFYSQKFRVLETLVFQELFSQRKVSLNAPLNQV